MHGAVAPPIIGAYKSGVISNLYSDFYSRSRSLKQNGGDANIGRKLYPLLNQSGFKEIKVYPRQVYVDDSNPKWVEGFTKNTFIAMIKGISEEAISKNLIGKKEFEKGIKDLNRTAEGGGTFCYTFFKGIGTK